jgi:hypothetical protein
MEEMQGSHPDNKKMGRRPRPIFRSLLHYFFVLSKLSSVLSICSATVTMCGFADSCMPFNRPRRPIGYPFCEPRL